MNMCFATRLIFSFAFLATKLSAVYSSIRFDEVEFYDPSKVLDESTSNGFVCAHLEEGCQITAQCCGVATCALPSWSETPVCLVPGYKHDERFRKRFFSLHNLQPADIRYIRDSYNTSQYDFLLTDFTFSAPPLDNVANTASSEVIAANASTSNDSVDAIGDLWRNISVDSTSSEDVAENSQTTNDSLVESYDKNSSMFLVNENMETGSNNSTEVSALDDSALVNKNYSRINSTNLSKIDDFDFKNRFMFLLINNSLGQGDYKLDLKEFYDQITDTDRFKNIVEQLREKMREINEIEKNTSNNNTENTTAFRYSSKETDKPTTERTKTTQKISKWDIVKKFLFHDKESLNDNHNFTSKNNTSRLKEIVDEIRSKETHQISNQENMSRKGFIQTDYPDNPSDNEGFKKLIADVDKIEEIIDSDRTINTFHGSNNVNDEGLFDFYNINVPISSFDGATEKTEGMNNSLENVFKDIGDTINSMILTNNGNGESEQDNLEMKKDSKENNLQQFSKKYSLNQSTLAKDEKTSTETHFWDKIHFWRVPQNVSAEVEKSFKRFLFRKEESSASEKQNKLTHLNEFFLLNLNSKHTQETVTPLPVEKIEQTSEYSSYLTSESESSSSEELYNNSYVFMVRKEQFEEPVKVSSWKKVVNFFHREKDVPVSLDLNIQNIPGRIYFDSESHPSKIEHKSNPSIVDVPEVIRLPEYLMPQALDERQGNETDWIFEDSEDLEDKIIEHKSSNSSFFFFFK